MEQDILRLIRTEMDSLRDLKKDINRIIDAHLNRLYNLEILYAVEVENKNDAADIGIITETGK
jgi:hypothetical protein